MNVLEKIGADRLIVGDGWRFLLAGGVNTLLTLLLYQALLFKLNAELAWSLAWFSGLVLVSLAYPKLVFKQGVFTLRRVGLNLVYYLFSYLLSLGLLSVFVNTLGCGPRLAAFAVLAVTVPLNFVCSRCIFTCMAGR